MPQGAANCPLEKLRPRSGAARAPLPIPLRRPVVANVIDLRACFAYENSMTVRPIITIPDPVLRKACAPVTEIDDTLATLIDDMLETMYHAPGVGLAAPQVNVPLRLIVMDTAHKVEERDPVVMINPEIVARTDERRVHEEGCLSIPEYYAEIERPAGVTVKYLDRNGQPQELTTDSFLATVIQHEVDHLDGKLFIDYLSRLRRDMVIRKFKKAKRHASEAAL